MGANRTAGVVRIGELSRRVGVSEHLLRAWESRYGLVTPTRSSGGYRLYSADDEQRVRRMQFHLASGLHAAEAARVAIADIDPPPGTSAAERGDLAEPPPDLVVLGDDLRAALDALDEPRAQAVLDRLLANYTLSATLRDVIVPYLRDLGDRWSSGDITIIQEHFASNLIRGRLAAISRGWGTGDGPRVVLACPPGELHDLPLVIFGIILNRQGWRIDFFGADTPIGEVIEAARRTPPDLVVLAATTPERLTAIGPELAQLAALAPLALAGAGASPTSTNGIDAQVLTTDPVTAAQQQRPA